MARDEGWRNAEGTWDRLRWARLRHKGYETAKDAAENLGIEAGTYRAYERPPWGNSKHIKLGDQHAFHIASRWGLRWEWLLRGEGEPWKDPDEFRERWLNVYDNAPPEMHAELAELAERLFRKAS